MHVTFLVVVHAPYVRQVGRAPDGEEPLHETIARTLLPLVSMLHELHSQQLKPRIALALSPLLMAQVADPVVQKHFILWMERRIAEGEAALAEHLARGDEHAVYLTRFDLEWNRELLRNFDERYKRQLIKELRELVAAGVIEVLAGAASHVYMPLISSAAVARALIEHGALHTARHLGHPQGLWLPGCGWRAGLDTVAADIELRYVVADPRSVAPGLAAHPHWLVTERLAVFFLDPTMAQHAWSIELGYRGDPLYRDPSVGDGSCARGLAGPQPYDPYHAFRRAQDHANHFVEQLAAATALRHDELLIVPLDGRILGGEWFEGSTWLQAVLTRCATIDAFSLTTPAAFLRSHRPRTAIKLRSATTLLGERPGGIDRQQIRALHIAELRLTELARQFVDARGARARALNQAARELLLALASAWPGPIDPTEGLRREIYLKRFHTMCDIALKPTLNPADRYMLEELEEQDGPFKNLNYRIFAN